MYKLRISKKAGKILLRISIPVILLLTGLSIFFLHQYQAATKVAQSLDPLQQIVAKISTLYPLPSNEQPVLAQVQGIEKLANQPFFKDAQDGDDVLLYKKNKLAIIYRPSTNTIIRAGSVEVNTTSTTTPQSTTPSHFAGAEPSLPSTN